MRKSNVALCLAFAASLVAASTVDAQAPARRSRYTAPKTPGPGGAARFTSPYGNFSAGNINTPTRGGRQLRRNTTPVLSPYLNLLPDAATTFEGQYLLRTIPQQEFTRSQQQTQQALQGLQGEIDQQESQIATGLSTTGHATSFMNLGAFYGGR